MTTSDSESPDLNTIAAKVAEHSELSAAGTLMERMEMSIVEVTPQRVVISMPVAGNTQPYGLLHGGASAVLAETVGSIGSGIHAAALGKIPVGIELSCTHHRAVRSGIVTAVGTPLSIGRSLATWEIAVTDDEDRRICTSRLTCMLREAPPGS
ncbi:MAG: hypothetical protein ACJAY5_001153 [Actinomycetes bacterium]|jgi:1,4-dihydroxy-2-naphthoyl-CoA hydrolase